MAGEPKMIKKLELFLLALQSTFGSGVSSLTASDYADVEGGSSLENNLTMHDIDQTSGTFNQPAMVPGDMAADASLIYRLRTWGDNDPGSVANAFQCAGFVITNLLKVYTLTPSSDCSAWKDATIWHYTGNLSAGGSLLEKANNVMFDWEISMPTGGIPKVTFTGVGSHVGAAINATQPTVTQDAQATKALIGVALTVNGTVYKTIEFNISGNQDVENTIDQSATYGRDRSLVTGKGFKWTAKVYATVTGDGDPFAELLAGTLATTSISWGVAPNKWTIASGSSKSQITSRKKSDNNGVTTFDLEGIFVDNDLTIDVDTTV